MSRYKIDTGLVCTKTYREGISCEFEADEEAWETLRPILPNKFAALYKEVEEDLPILNREEYLKAYYGTYGSMVEGEWQPTKTIPNIYRYWKPIFIGLTNDKYDL